MQFSVVITYMFVPVTRKFHLSILVQNKFGITVAPTIPLQQFLAETRKNAMYFSEYSTLEEKLPLLSDEHSQKNKYCIHKQGVN